MPTIYTFEAKSIQNYILDSSKLKDMIGASEQIEYLCHEDGLLDQVLNSLDLKDTKFARRAGGAFQAIFPNNDDAKRFQAVWTFSVQQAMPGLNFVQGIGANDDWKQAIEIADEEFKKDDHNHQLLTLPLAGPLVARSPRTGQPAVSVNNKLKERLDATTKSKRQFRTGKLLTDKLKFDIPIEWPINLNKKDKEDENEKTFPLLDDNNYIAIIHADGNNFGQLLQELRKKLLQQNKLQHYTDILMAFSQSIETANVDSTRKAIKHEKFVKAATKNFQIMPARPLVLGGDDFTFIVRGDLALDFTKIFLETFEELTQKALTKLKEEYNELDFLPSQLTAAAGIAYIKASQPFYQGYALAESLCKHAKSFSKDHCKNNDLIPSSVAFHRITTSIINDYDTILKRELTIDDKIQMTMQPYLVGKIIPSKHPHEFPRLEDLQNLQEWLKNNEVSHGVVREFLNNIQQAEPAIQRWHENMKKREQTDLLKNLKNILTYLKLDEQPSNSLKFLGSEVDKKERTPIGDALALISVSKGE